MKKSLKTWLITWISIVVIWLVLAWLTKIWIIPNWLWIKILCSNNDNFWWMKIFDNEYSIRKYSKQEERDDCVLNCKIENDLVLSVDNDNEWYRNWCENKYPEIECVWLGNNPTTQKYYEDRINDKFDGSYREKREKYDSCILLCWENPSSRPEPN